MGFCRPFGRKLTSQWHQASLFVDCKSGTCWGCAQSVHLLETGILDVGPHSHLWGTSGAWHVVAEPSSPLQACGSSAKDGGCAAGWGLVHPPEEGKVVRTHQCWASANWSGLTKARVIFSGVLQSALIHGVLLEFTTVGGFLPRKYANANDQHFYFSLKIRGFNFI